MSVLIPLGYMAVIFILSSIPDTGETGHLLNLVSAKIQNLLHIPAFGLLAFLWILALKAYGVAERSSILMAFVLATGYGAFTELYQAWIPGRFPSVWDFMRDLAGIVILIMIYERWHRSAFLKYARVKHES